MIKVHVGMVAVMAMAMTFGLPNLGVAGHLPAPEGLSCPFLDQDGDSIMDVVAADWEDVTNATKYAVHLIAGYDTDGDGVADATVDFDFGTSDRTDEAPMSASFLNIPLSELAADVTDDGIDNPMAPIEVQVRVKALHPGKNQGNQSGMFSGLCTAM